ncbi:protein of unassigned function [Methylobacterium oryzae CBMB20]|uniref:Protein of unassigned function n=1 Tax=Methylobacterium oryzae CBMB20 TaxID=693986 RepID=A0A089NMW7_9HYPH|nr:protein of unassigned function [Methylobacterium oryzae CBMB20]
MTRTLMRRDAGDDPADRSLRRTGGVRLQRARSTTVKL